jgi:uncharacterized protein YciI
MLYILEGHDSPQGAARRAQLRPMHLERVRQLVNEGRVIIGGPIPELDSNDPTVGVLGSLIVAEFDSLEAASRWWQADPYVTGGVFDKTHVRPLRAVVP